ncbi:LTA synthase family protein [Streptococcus suis]|nr:LTA synthase family protein [Streptococcus suis]
MKQINPKASKQFILVMIMTVLLAMGRALLLSGVSFPLWFIPLPLLAYSIFTFYVLVLLDTYEKFVKTKTFAKYVGYFLGFLYLVNLVYRLNAKKYQPWNIFRNNLFQFELLLMLALPIILALFLHKNRNVRERLRSWSTKHLEPDVYLLLTTLFSLSPLAISYWKDSHYESLIENGSYTEFFSHTPIFATIHFVVMYCFLRYLYKCFNEFKANRTNVHSMLFISLALATISHIGYQASMAGGTGSYFSRHLFPGAIIFQIACLFFLNVIISLVLNRQLLSVALIACLNVTLITANFLKFRYRSEPLTPNDFKWIGNIGMIFSFISVRVVLVTLLFLVILIFIYRRLRTRYFLGAIVQSFWKRLAGISVIVSLIVGMGWAIRNEKDHKIVGWVPILSPVNNWRNVDWKGYAFVARYRTLSFLWLQQLSKTSMEEPQDYSEKTMKAIVKKYTELAEEINAERAGQLTDQTVIYVLSESFADPRRVPGVTISQNVIPNLEYIMSQTTSGLMKSDHYGGGTANIEFQVYSGLPFYNYSSSISSVYLDVAPNMKKFPSISDLYDESNRVAIHPYYDTSYNRNTIYKQLGIDQFYSLNSLQYPITVADTDYQGNFVSDRKTYDLILDRVRSTDNKFVSAITMQNHVQWNSSEPATITATGQGFTAEENENLNSYVRLLSFTDQATRDFLDQLKTLDKKVTVVFYGDHLPGLYPESAFVTDPSAQYKTDYFVWSNFETEDYHYDLINSSDMNALMLETTNNKVSPYYALLTEVLHKDRVGQAERDATVAEELKLVQYDLSAGKGYLLKYKDFFKVATETTE